MGIHGWFNAFEALLWMGIAVTLFLCVRRMERERRRVGRVAAFGFVLFGVTDVIEIYTGNWAEPLGLLLLNAFCILLLLSCLYRYAQIRKRQE